MILTRSARSVALLSLIAVIMGVLSFTATAGTSSLNLSPALYVLTVNTTISPKAVFIVGDNRLLLVGSANGSSCVELLDVSDPYVGGKPIQVYPLVGTITAVATNGYPVERVAVGTDKGDLAVFKPSGGKLYLTLHAVFHNN